MHCDENACAVLASRREVHLQTEDPHAQEESGQEKDKQRPDREADKEALNLKIAEDMMLLVVGWYIRRQQTTKEKIAADQCGTYDPPAMSCTFSVLFSLFFFNPRTLSLCSL